MENRENVVDALCEMIQCRTVSKATERDEREFDRLKGVLKTRFPKTFQMAEEIPVGSGLLLHIKGEDSKSPLILMSHMDVVSVNEKEWTHSAFSGAVINDAVWGRGAVDTKGSLAAIFESTEQILCQNQRLRRDLYLFSSSSEEVAGEDAVIAASYFREHDIRPLLVMDEGGGIIDRPLKGVNGRFAMIALGEVCKGSLRFEGDEKNVQKFVRKLKRKKFASPEFSPEMLAMFDAMHEHMSGITKCIFSHFDFFRSLLKKVLPKLSPEAAAMMGYQIKIAEKDAAHKNEITLDLSSTYYCDINEICKKVTELAQTYSLKLTKKRGRFVPITPEPIKGFGFEFCKTTVLEVFENVTPSPFIIFGGTDARHFVGIAESVIRFAPIYLDQKQFHSFHRTDENLYISSLLGAVKFYRKVLEKLCL